MRFRIGVNSVNIIYVKTNKLLIRRHQVIEPLLLGMVLGLIFITLLGLFFAAYMQYKRGDQLGMD
ncbi:MAG: cytochrome b6-f complex subunit PetG [Xenococcaceae cyanobacterium MO_188.B19]|nr:cytochrome b6-f complex subunit PetG [Xenococcaceae cyanobacterium MO_188.B19]